MTVVASFATNLAATERKFLKKDLCLKSESVIC